MRSGPAEKSQQVAMSFRAWAMLILLGFVWGGSFFLGRIAVTEIPPLSLVLFRVALAAAALHLWLWINRISFSPVLKRKGAFFSLALFNNAIPFSLIFLGQTELGAGPSAIWNATTPFWTLIIASFFTVDEKMTFNKFVGIAFGICGVAVMIGPSVLMESVAPTWPKIAILFAAVSYAIAAVYAKRFRGVSPVIIATGQLTCSTLIMLPAVLLIDGIPVFTNVSSNVWLAVIVLALIATAFAYLLYFSLIGMAGATNTSLVTLVVPVSAVLLGAAFLAERLELAEIVGMGLIFLGLLLIDGRLLHSFKTPAPDRKR